MLDHLFPVNNFDCNGLSIRCAYGLEYLTVFIGGDELQLFVNGTHFSYHIRHLYVDGFASAFFVF